jgi:hypothetical protein
MSGERRGKDGRIGDATRQKIDDLADGWAVPEGTGATRAVEDASPGDPDDSVGGRERKKVALPAPSGGSPVPKKPPPPLPPRPGGKRGVGVPRPSKDPKPDPEPVAVAAEEASPEGKSKRPYVEPKGPDITNLFANEIEEADIGGAIDVQAPTLPAASLDQVPSPRGRARSQEREERLRTMMTLQRKRGVWGDMRYVFSVVVGVADAKRSLARTEKSLDNEERERENTLLDVGRRLCADSQVMHPRVVQARESLAELEAGMAQKTKVVKGTEGERDEVEAKHHAGLAEVDASISAEKARGEQLSSEIASTEKEANQVRRKAAELRSRAKAVEVEIGEKESALVANAEDADPVQLEADIAALRAELENVRGDEPGVVSDLKRVEPVLDELKRKLRDSTRTTEELEAKHKEAVDRYQERCDALDARLAVERREVADVEGKVEELYRQTAERLAGAKDAPEVHMRPIKPHDDAIEALEKRITQLNELVGGVDRAKLLRGLGLWLVVLGAVGAVLYFTVL